jgi:hypothetical protein
MPSSACCYPLTTIVRFKLCKHLGSSLSLSEDLKEKLKQEKFTILVLFLWGNNFQPNNLFILCEAIFFSKFFNLKTWILQIRLSICRNMSLHFST